MARHAIINSEGQVVNVIEWDGSTQWTPPEGYTVIESEIADACDTFCHVKHNFTKACNGKTYHKSCKHADYINGCGHIEEDIGKSHDRVLQSD